MEKITKNDFFKILNTITFIVFIIAAYYFSPLNSNIKQTVLSNPIEYIAAYGGLLIQAGAVAFASNVIIRTIVFGVMGKYKAEIAAEKKMNATKYFEDFIDKNGFYFESDWTLAGHICFKFSMFRSLMIVFVALPIFIVAAAYYDFIKGYFVLMLFSTIVIILIYFLWDKILIVWYKRKGIVPIKFKILQDGITFLPQNRTVKFNQIENITIENYEGGRSRTGYLSNVDIAFEGENNHYSKSYGGSDVYLITYLKELLNDLGFIEEPKPFTILPTTTSSIFRYSK